MALLLAAGVLAVAGTALAAASSLRPESPVSFLLAAYVAATAELVVLGGALSLVGAVSTPGYVVGVVVLLAAAIAWWNRRGRPRPPRLVLPRDPVVLVLAAAFVASILWELAAGFLTAPNNGDSLTYRLSRTALWLEDGGVHWIDAAHTDRQNVLPGNYELEMLFTFATLRSDLAAFLPQLVSHVALALGVAGLARRVGFERPAAAFAGLVAAALPQIALQGSSTQNDLTAAALIVAAAYFLLGRTPVELGLAGAALGLAAGVKATVAIALPGVVLLALVALPPRQLLRMLACAVAATAVFAGYWYAQDIAKTGDPLGASDELELFRPQITPAGTVSTIARATYRFVDFTGVPGARTSWLDEISDAGSSTFDALGIDPNPRASMGHPFTFTINVRSHEDHSFFGVLGFLLVVPLSVGFAVAWAVRRTTALRGALALALPLGLFVLALLVRFSDDGRYLIAPVALTMPLAAAVFRSRALAAATAVVAMIGLAVTHVDNELRPSGLSDRPATWALSREEQQALDAPTRLGLLEAVARVPEDADVGVVLAPSDWDHPLFGPDLERRLVTLPHQEALVDAERRGLRYVVFGTAWQPVRRGWSTQRYEAGILAIRD